MCFNLIYKRFSEQAILIEWPAKIGENILKDIISFKNKILIKNIKQILELNDSYNSLLVIYKFEISDFDTELEILKNIYKSDLLLTDENPVIWEIPVCYDAFFGLDLEYISQKKNITKSDIIQLHSETLYVVYFIGFLPGFLYLGGLNEKLHISRKPTPRMKIEKGAVAIGGGQTGVYPNESPGGWNIIGNSPINFFDISKDKPCFAKSGDYIQFIPVSIKAHQDIKFLVDANVYQINNKLLHD